VLKRGLATLPTFGPPRLLVRGYDEHLTALRRLIWLYFALLIAEGALRKWAVPSLSAPLLIIRDPLVLLIYIQAARCRRFPVSGPILVCFLLFSGFLLLALFQMIAGIGGGPVVAAYGLRTDFLHLPLIFIIPQVFSYADVLKVGKWVLRLSMPMAALMVWQFLSPPGSWINAGTIAGAGQLAFALGKIRPAGAFSFETGAAHFFVLATAFLLFGFAQPRAGYSPWLLGAALLSVLVVQPVSGSRLLVLGCALAAAAAITFAIFQWKRAHRILGVLAMISLTLIVLSLTAFFRDAVSVFMVRWNQAGGGSAADSLIARILGGFLEPFRVLPEVGLFGLGIGVGTNAGSALMTGAVQFLLAEGEWARVVMEAGPLFGFSFIAYRGWIAVSLAIRGIANAQRQNLLAWLLAWDACRSLLTEQISQPTNLGFMVVVAGLCLASMPELAPILQRDRERFRKGRPTNWSQEPAILSTPAKVI
jgi:hypothetical protein